MSATELAARKLLEALTEANCDTEDDFWAEATDPKRGLRYRVNNNTIWYRFRNRHFTRTGRDGRYGDQKVLRSYGEAAKWKGLLCTLVANHLAEVTEDRNAVVLVNDPRGGDFLRRLRLLTSSLQKIRGLEQIASSASRD